MARHGFVKAWLMLALGAASGPASAQLVWDRTTVSHTAAESEDRFVAEFPYWNTGGSVVIVQSVKASCGCTEATIDRDAIAPGESGVLRAKLEYGSRVGPQRLRINVTTADSPLKPTVLEFNVDIPVLVQSSANVLHWSAEKPVSAQTFDLTIQGDSPRELRDAKCQPELFALQTEVIEAGRKYRLTVTPGPDAKPGSRATITVRTGRTDARGSTVQVPLMMDRPFVPMSAGRKASIRK